MLREEKYINIIEQSILAFFLCNGFVESCLFQYVLLTYDGKDDYEFLGFLYFKIRIYWDVGVISN